MIRFRDNKTFFMLKSAKHEMGPANKLLTVADSFLLCKVEHENLSAIKYENAKYCRHFLCISGENSMLS